MPLDATALHRAFVGGDLRALRVLLGDPEDFPNVELPSGFSDTALDYAILWSSAEFVSALLDLGADPGGERPDGFPPLVSALHHRERPAERLAIVRALLEHGADANVRGLFDGTPLHFAVAARDTEAIRLLLEHGADPAARRRIDDEESPLELARALGFDEGVALLS